MEAYKTKAKSKIGTKQGGHEVEVREYWLFTTTIHGSKVLLSPNWSWMVIVPLTKDFALQESLSSNSRQAVATQLHLQFLSLATSQFC